MELEATYTGEELSVTFVVSRTEFSDYGEIEISTLLILGIEVNPSILPPELQDAIHALSKEVEFGR
jgi:hypothetical protein